MNQQPRLNILRLPSQMITVVVMIALVLLGGLASLNAARSDLIFIPLALGLLLISLRRLLTWADEERARHRLTPAGADFESLQERIDSIAAQLCLRHSPHLLIAPGDYDLRIFGSWRRWYIGIDRERAQRLKEMAADPALSDVVDAALTHELFHFKHHDNIWIGYVESLLRNGLILILWFSLLLNGMVWLAAMAGQNFLVSYSPDQLGAIFDRLLPGQGDNLAHTMFGSQEEFEKLRTQAEGIDFAQTIINIWSNALPFLMIGGALLLQFWRQFLRLREIYADAGVAQTRGEVANLIKAVTVTGRASNEGVRRLDVQLREHWRRLRAHYFGSGLRFSDRLTYLHHPEQLYGSARSYGCLVGLFVNFLNLVLFSTAAIFVAGNWPLHFIVVASLILIALYLLPSLAMGSDTPIARDIWVMMGFVVGLFAALMVLSLGILIIGALVDPIYTSRLLQIFVSVVSWYSGPVSETLIGDPWVLIAEALPNNLLQIPTLALAIGGPVAALVVLIRRMLTWYGLPGVEQRLMRAVVILILLMAALVAFVALPPITDLILRRDMVSLPSPWYWGGVALTLVLAGIFGAWCLIQDRLYAGRCAHCHRHAPGPFALGKRCPHADCAETLHPWLEAHYSVEAHR